VENTTSYLYRIFTVSPTATTAVLYISVAMGGLVPGAISMATECTT
jgi:hypothetical protein